MTRLPTLGGYKRAPPTRSTNRGEVVGIAENSTPDADCPAPQVVQVEPVVCKGGRIQELRTFAGNPGGIAFGINENGQVVGQRKFD